MIVPHNRATGGGAYVASSYALIHRLAHSLVPDYCAESIGYDADAENRS